MPGGKNSMPFYVTREHGRAKETVAYSQSYWMSAVVQLLAWSNAVLWGVYGVIQAVGHLL